MAIDKILIIGEGMGLPVGWASTSRLINLAKSVRSANVGAEIFLVRATESPASIKNNLVKGEVGGISYSYPPSGPIISGSFLGRRLQNLSAFWFLSKYLMSAFRSSEKCAIIAYVRNISTLALVSCICRIFRVKLVLELCEWTESIPTASWLVRQNNRLFSRYSIYLVDGFLTISESINRKLVSLPWAKNGPPQIITVPILVDPREFRQVVWKPECEHPYILFCGNFSYIKTIDLILRAFENISSVFPNLRLVLAGSSASDPNHHRVLKIASDLRITGRVNISGFVTRENLLKLMAGSSALLIPLFFDEQSNSRFPTKLAEYLLSGSPVVTTAVGEVAKYLTHGVNAYVAADDSAESFARCITESLVDQRRAENIGQNGRKMALEEFCHARYGEKIYDFLESLQ